VFWLIPALCAAIAVACTTVAAVACARAWGALQDHADRLQAATPLALLDSARLEMAVTRIGRDFEGMNAQLARMVMAVNAIRAGIAGLRLREAMAAVRVAGLALRALRALF
jgi:hypothetical protein